MSRFLTRGIYEPRPKPFGLQYGQKRFDHVLCHDAGWFNAVGERLGIGDLNHQDFYAISDGLSEDEMFVVVPSYLEPDAAVWLTDGLVCSEGPEGMAYLEACARYVILRGKILMVWRNDEGQSASCLRVTERILGLDGYSTIKSGQIAKIAVSPQRFIAA